MADPVGKTTIFGMVRFYQLEHTALKTRPVWAQDLE